MWDLQSSVGELVFRALAIYVFVFVLFRLIGKKQLGEMSPFDFVLLLIISESVSNALSGGDESLAAGFILAFSLLGFSYVIDALAFKSKRFEKIMDGSPAILIDHGKINEKVQRKEQITYAEILESVHKSGLEKIEDVKFGILETNGKISIIEK